jgi:DNA-binding CsgD family transcriptional regulator
VGRGREAARVRDRARAGQRPGETATERDLAVVAAVLATGSEKAAAHRLALSHSTVKHHLANARSRVGATATAQLVWILATRLPEPEGRAPQPSEPADMAESTNQQPEPEGGFGPFASTP